MNAGQPVENPDYALDYTCTGMLPSIEGALKGYGVSRKEDDSIAEPLTDAGIAHYPGDATSGEPRCTRRKT
jgi:hypothetical protein